MLNYIRKKNPRAYLSVDLFELLVHLLGIWPRPVDGGDAAEPVGRRQGVGGGGGEHAAEAVLHVDLSRLQC